MNRLGFLTRAAASTHFAAARANSCASGHRLARCRSLLAALALALVATGCFTTPVTGRSSLNVFSMTDDAQLGTQAFQQVKETEPIRTSGESVQMVERIMTRLVAAAAQDDPGFEWEVVVIDRPDTVNAFALPGGKMAVYTGLLPVAQDEDGLAVVMAHEIAHVVARHGTERMTSSLGSEVALQMLGASTGGNAEVTTQLAAAALDLTLQRPHGRKQESEADHIGLIYMAAAGYDPRAAIGFWSRMAQAGGDGPPEFLSTHPSHETRIADLQKLMPEAISIYEGRSKP